MYVSVTMVSDMDAKGARLNGSTPEGPTPREVIMRERDRASVDMRFYEAGRLVRQIGGELTPGFCTRYACDWIRGDRP
jgi:hypothetical protein